MIATQPSVKSPTDKHRALAVFAGEWALDGQNLDGAVDRPLSHLTGESTYRWLTGEFFLSGVEDTDSEGDRHVSTFIYGFDEASGKYHIHFFDNGGSLRVYVGDVNGDRWRFDGLTERVRIDVEDGGDRLRHFWERKDEAKGWIAICDFTSTKKS